MLRILENSFIFLTIYFCFQIYNSVCVFHHQQPAMPLVSLPYFFKKQRSSNFAFGAEFNFDSNHRLNESELVSEWGRNNKDREAKISSEQVEKYKKCATFFEHHIFYRRCKFNIRHICEVWPTAHIMPTYNFVSK